MLKPKLELDLKPIIEKKVIEVKQKKDQQILLYALESKGLTKNFNAGLLSHISHNGKDIYSYDGKALVKVIPIDKEGLHFKYEIEN